MTRIILSLLVAIWLAPMAWASCDGRDLRPLFDKADAAELADRLAAYPYAQGNHWQATKGDRVLHLVGTVHVHDPRLAPVVARLRPVIETADLVLVEGTEEDKTKLQKAMVERPELAYITEGPTLPDLLPSALWQDLSAAASARGYPSFLAAKTQPWFLTVMLSLPGCAMEGLRRGLKGLDDQIIQIATNAEIPTRSLEPYDTLFTILGSDPLDEQIELLRLGILPESVTEDSTTTLMESYFEEKTAEILEVSRFVSRAHVNLSSDQVDALFADMLDKLLTQRNLAWMDHILAAPKGTTIVAVGAGHLTGPNGLLVLLEQAGYRLERQPF